MKIRFSVNNSTYELSSDRYQMLLNEIKIIQKGENAGKESTILVGYFKNEFQALKAILDYEKYMSDCSTFAELEKLTVATINRLNELCDTYDFKSR